MNPLWQSRFSDKVIAVSESTARDLINIYGIDPVKIENVKVDLTIVGGSVVFER